MNRAAPLAVLLAALAVSGSAQADPKTAALDAFLASGAAPHLSDFLAKTGGRAAFAAFAPDAPAAREKDWKDCDAMLAGGRRDPDGAALRAVLVELPPQQLYFAGRLYAATKALYAELGSGRLGNAQENLGLCAGRKCFERADALIARMDAVVADPAFRMHWASTKVDAVPGEWAEHTAACFRFTPGSRAQDPTAELVADPWDDAFLAPPTWFAAHDPKTRDALAAAGKDWCGRTFEGLRKARRDQLVEQEKRADERVQKLKTLEESFSRLATPY